MKLAHRTIGEGPHVAFVHGFTQTSKSWDQVVHDLPSFACTTIDAPGHGVSPDGARTLIQCGNDIADTMFPGSLVGYSMGARMCLHTALQQPHVVQKLVLISGTAGIEEHIERTQRVASDGNLADHIESVGVPEFITEWLANPMFAGLSTESAQLNERLTNTASGLANSLRYAGTGTQTPLWSRLHELTMPVLLVAGEQDKKFSNIAERMHSMIPHSRLYIVPECGHTVHLEKHASFMQILIDFLS